MSRTQSRRRRRGYFQGVIPENETVYEISSDLIPPTGPKVLVLDDDQDLTSLLERFLKSKYYRVEVVDSGVEGIKMIMGQDFDVILCDMMMPHMPGTMFYKAVERAKPELCRRFIFMTGHAGDRKIDSFIRSVRGLMLWKPFEMQQLVDAIESMVRRFGTHDGIP